MPHSTRKPPGCATPHACMVRSTGQCRLVASRSFSMRPFVGRVTNGRSANDPERGRARHPKPAPNPTCRNHRRPNRPRAISNPADGRLSGSRLRRSLSGGGGNLPLLCSGKPRAFTNLTNRPPSGFRPTSLTFRPGQQPATPAFRQSSGLRQTHQQTVFGHTVLTLVGPVHLRRAMACCCHGHPSGLGDTSGNR